MATARALILILALALLVAALGEARADGQQRVAVLEFEIAPGVKQIDRTYLSDRARGAVHDAAPRLFVMTRESSEMLLQANGKSMADCTGECEVEVGRKLGADFIISGRVTQFGSRTSLTMRLFSTGDGQLLSNAEARGKSADELLDGMDAALAKLLGPLSADAQLKAAPPAAPPPAPSLKPVQNLQPAPAIQPAPAAQPAPTAVRDADAAKGKVFNVELRWAPGRGAQEPLVTIVEWADYQCPFSAKVEPVLQQLLQEYAGKLSLHFNDLPLPFHPQAVGAARAAAAAARQEKYWEMHDLLFAHQKELADEKYALWAQQLGLDVERFKQDQAAPGLTQMLERSKEYANQLGATGTPSFFINGVFVSGAQSIERFRALIDEQLLRAQALLASGVQRRDLYDALVRDGLRAAPPPPPAKAALARAVEPGPGPAQGPLPAKVTLVEWGDHQCPFTARAEATLQKLRELYPDSLRIVWRDNPLAFHPQAMAAARAARAAGLQGHFWEMHDLLFAHQQELGDDNYHLWARQLGLDVQRFRRDLASAEEQGLIRNDIDEAAKLGTGGTPAFFINGKPLTGAQPIEVFRAVIDEQLTKADALLAAGTPPDQLYARLVDENVRANPQ